MICNHPYCSKVAQRAHCGRHWFALSEDLRDRLKHCKSTAEKGALLVGCREYFEERMIGRHEIVTCRGADCEADVVWMLTSRGKNIPVNADGVARDDDLFQYGKHIAHWTTCPNANDFRKPAGGP